MSFSSKSEGHNLDAGGKYLSKLGVYDLKVVEKSDETTNGGDTYWKVTFGVLSAADPKNADQIGKVFDISFFMPDSDSEYFESSLNRILGFADATGVYTKSEQRADQDAGREFRFNDSLLQGKTLVANVGKRTNKNTGAEYKTIKRMYQANADTASDQKITLGDPGLFNEAGEYSPGETANAGFEGY